MTRVPKVRAWSNTVRKGSFDPSDVDLFVLRDREEILLALGRRRADGGRDAVATRSEAPSRPSLDGAGLLLLLAPVMTIAAYGGRVPGSSGGVVADPMSSEVAVVYTAVCFLVAVPGPVLVARRWHLAHRRRDWLEIAYLVLTTLLGVRVLSSMLGEWDAAPLGPTSLPVWFTTVAAALVLVAMAVGSVAGAPRRTSASGWWDRRTRRGSASWSTPCRPRSMSSCSTCAGAPSTPCASAESSMRSWPAGSAPNHWVRRR